MSDNLVNQLTDPLPQPSLDERLAKIELLLVELSASQQQSAEYIHREMSSLRQDMNERYADLRDRVEINNDKLDVVQRELRRLIKDLRNPILTSVDTR